MTHPVNMSNSMPPTSAGMWLFNRPMACAFFTISIGYLPVRSNSAATGMISSRVNLRATSWNSRCSSDKPNDGPALEPLALANWILLKLAPTARKLFGDTFNIIEKIEFSMTFRRFVCKLSTIGRHKQDIVLCTADRSFNTYARKQRMMFEQNEEKKYFSISYLSNNRQHFDFGLFFCFLHRKIDSKKVNVRMCLSRWKFIMKSDSWFYFAIFWYRWLCLTSEQQINYVQRPIQSTVDGELLIYCAFCAAVSVCLHLTHVCLYGVDREMKTKQSRCECETHGLTSARTVYRLAGVLRVLQRTRKSQFRIE